MSESALEKLLAASLLNLKMLPSRSNQIFNPYCLTPLVLSMSLAETLILYKEYIALVIEAAGQLEPRSLCRTKLAGLLAESNLFFGNLDRPIQIEVILLVVLKASMDASYVVVAYGQVLAQGMHLVMASVLLNGLLLFQEDARHLVVIEYGSVVVTCEHSRPRDVEGLDHLVGCSV